MAQIPSKSSPDSANPASENPYELTLRLLAQQKVGTLKRIMEKKGKKLRVSEAQIADYITGADPDLPDVIFFLKNSQLRGFWNGDEDATVMESGMGFTEDNDIVEQEIIEEEKAIGRNRSAGIRAYYLTRELLSDKDLTGAAAFMIDLLEGVVRKAGECGFQLPAPWTKAFAREAITRLFFEGHQQSEIHKARIKKDEQDDLAAGRAHYGTSNEILAEFDKIENDELRELTTKYPTPAEFVMKYLDLRAMVKLKAIQSDVL